MRPITALPAGLFITIAVATAASMPIQSTQPQTAHHENEPPQHTNRLIDETSPYLLQHAHNPVDWHAWGSEAFDAARQADKPIFLSIGYSTCYWCHVMERESFESEEIAAIMNENFICIKVDREERPDVDDIYMAAVQIVSGQGGWPMSVFLEPRTLKPFFAGTYFPPRDNFGRPGFPSVLRHIAAAWSTMGGREALTTQADQIAAAVKEHLSRASEPVAIGSKHVEKTIAALLAGYDRQDGGFVSPVQKAPKFPTPVNLDFLIGAAWDLKPARDAVLHTLDRMAIGGMYDQIGGGFHRYSTDEKWLVPHFEKMLYDNGQLASTYARAYELTKDEFYAQIIRETLDYVLREMISPSGAFYSAQDAEVDAREGANYIWTDQEVRDALTAAGLHNDVEFALNTYGLNTGPNFQDPHHPEEDPKNVLYLSHKPTTNAESSARLTRVDNALLAVRQKRKQPSTDDKILAGWNGLMIAGFADGGRVLNEKKYKDAADKAAQFVLHEMRNADGGLLRSYRNGRAKIDAVLEDYALMIRGLIALHRATNDRRALEDARKLMQLAKARFWDSSSESGGAGGVGGFFDTLEGQSDLFVRAKSAHDGAIPCGNSVMLLNLLDLHELTAQSAYLDDAAATLKSLSSAIDEHPTASVLSVLGLKRMVDHHPQRIDQQPTARTTGGAGGAGGATSTTRAAPLEISVNPKEVQVKPRSPATFEISLKINRPYHITSHDPGDEFLIPLKVNLTGCEGLSATIDYPRGEQYKGEMVEGTVYVHSGTVVLPVRIEQTGKFTGTPKFTLTYQACTDKECLEPKTEIVGIRIIAQR